MKDLREVWIPRDQFRKEYPTYNDCYLVQVNEYVVLYEITEFESDVPHHPRVYFSLDEALDVMTDD